MPTSIIRIPTINDGEAVFKLVKSSPPLDLNSQYYYHIICNDFSETSVIVEEQNKIIAFCSSYFKPKNPKVLFIWQIAVEEEYRKLGIATKILNHLKKNLNIQSIETTISPSNKASQKLFESFAKYHKATINKKIFLSASNFGENNHEEETLYKIKL
jgi:L-2,4-diaminobutyric acid acetyltransferase